MIEPPKDGPYDPCVDDRPHVFDALAVPPKPSENYIDFKVETFCTRCGKLRTSLDPVARHNDWLRMNAMFEALSNRNYGDES